MTWCEMPRLSEYAYCTPLARCSKLSKEAAHKYGGIRQRRLFLGGGPFVLEDSDDLSERMMKRLGYLDGYNTDIHEAGFVFANVSDNKHNLRQMGMLSDSLFLMSQLRSAFLADLTAQWHLAPVDSQVRAFLLQENYIRSEKAGKQKVWKAMRKYARKGHLPGPDLKSYNGLVWRINRGIFMEKDPSKSSIVEVQSDRSDTLL